MRPRAKRDYERLARAAAAVAGTASSEERMRQVVDLLWEGLRHGGVSWLGFYVAGNERASDRCLVLGPCRDTPACSPIGLHGVCGKAFRSGRTEIVDDVTDLGADYIACDPRDRSEIVIPIIEAAGLPWAVLDLDSWDVGAFDGQDDAGLRRVLKAAGFTPA